ncbi:unnamed protein product [Symbiodinium sp. KB8]|nr:unnamed protein product [Symbiodinium sp. KB8]
MGLIAVGCSSLRPTRPQMLASGFRQSTPSSSVLKRWKPFLGRRSTSPRAQIHLVGEEGHNTEA